MLQAYNQVSALFVIVDIKSIGKATVWNWNRWRGGITEHMRLASSSCKWSRITDEGPVPEMRICSIFPVVEVSFGIPLLVYFDSLD